MLFLVNVVESNKEKWFKEKEEKGNIVNKFRI